MPIAKTTFYAICAAFVALSMGVEGRVHAAEAAAGDSDWLQVDFKDVPAAPSKITTPDAKSRTAIEEKSRLSLTKKDATMRTGVERWAKLNGWSVSWEIPYKLPIKFEATFDSDLFVALNEICEHFKAGGAEIRIFAYESNRVLRIVTGDAKITAPDSREGKDAAGKALKFVTLSDSYWLGDLNVTAASETAKEADKTTAPAARPQKNAKTEGRASRTPAILNSSITLSFSDKATLATVTGLLSKVTGIEISLPVGEHYTVANLVSEPSAKDSDKKGAKEKKPKSDEPAERVLKTYKGTPKDLLDRISVATGMLWEFQEQTIFFIE